MSMFCSCSRLISVWYVFIVFRSPIFIEAMCMNLAPSFSPKVVVAALCHVGSFSYIVDGLQLIVVFCFYLLDLGLLGFVDVVDFAPF